MSTDFDRAWAARQAAEGRGTSSAGPTASGSAASWRSAQFGPQRPKTPAEVTGWVDTSNLAGIARLSNPYSGFWTKPAASMDEAINEFYDVYYGGSPAVRAALDQIAKRQRSTPKGIWEDMTYMSNLRSKEGVYMTPMDILYETYLGFESTTAPRGGPGSYGRGGFGGGGGSSTQMTIDITTPTGARALLTQAMQGLLGRDPSDDEIATFTTALNESQQANPQVVTAMGDTVTRTGGFEADVFAMDFAKNQEEFQEVQGTQFYRALMDALGGGGI